MKLNWLFFFVIATPLSFRRSEAMTCDEATSALFPSELSVLGPLPKPLARLLESIVDRPAVFTPTVPETHAVRASRVELRGQFFPARFALSEDRTSVTLSPRSDDNFFSWGGLRFVEATNPSSVTVKTSTGHQEILLPRAVLPYENTLDPVNGNLNAPKGYYSHVPMLKRRGEQWDFDGFLLKSDPDKHFFFEDPRISGPFFDAQGQEQYFLGGTDYSRHVEGEEGLFVRNVMYPLEFKDGRIQPLEIDATTGKPKKALYVSPKPKRMPEGWRAVDAKNGLITQTDDGGIVVHTRFRVEASDDPVYRALREKYGDRVPTWKYSIQAFRFKSYEDFLAYDWDHAMEDLLGQAIGLRSDARSGRTVPQATIVLKDSDVRDFIPPALRVAGKPLGLGNGARRVRLVRQGHQIFASFNKRSEQFLVGEVPRAFRGKGRFVLEEGEVSYLGLDHQLGYFKDLNVGSKENRGTKRVYSGMASLYGADAVELKAVYANLVQPLRPHQISGTGGILDLNHAAYFMGANLVPDPRRPGYFTLRAYAGAADAHSESFDFDLIQLLVEMSPGSERWASGQVYRP